MSIVSKPSRSTPENAYIKIVKFEFSEAVVQSLFDIVRVVLAVPEFGGLGC